MIFIFKLNCKKGVQVDMEQSIRSGCESEETLCLSLILLSIRMTIGREICKVNKLE